MTAVIGFDRDELNALVAETTDVVSIANDNSDAQVVLSGSPEAVGTRERGTHLQAGHPSGRLRSLPFTLHG